MTDLDERIASVLRERAEGETDTHRLLLASRARGRRRQLRRRTATGTALALVGVLGLVGVTGTDVGGLTDRLPWTAATSGVAAPVPPRVDGVQGAARRPDLVGADPNVLHLGVDPGRARYLRWAVHPANRVESIQFSVGGGRPVTVEVSPSADAVDQLLLDGVPLQQSVTGLTFDGSVRQFGGTAGGLVTAWQPVPGLYARASTLGGDRMALARAVNAVRWDEPRRCAVPLRLDALPAGATVSDCSVDATAFPTGLRVDLTLQRESSAVMWVRLVYGAQIAGSTLESNRTVGGRPAHLHRDGRTLELLGIPKAHVTAEFGSPLPGTAPPAGYPALTEADAATVLAGARIATDLTDPDTWE
ncbi:hypothetical protein ACGF7U_24445 [Micromonospora sp. NPDC047670]|uniref:hypothetical protein n=1 Tax=Micromonospora sp. NPDC047670 TaxID=3364252 RepID=UPI0037248D3C